MIENFSDTPFEVNEQEVLILLPLFPLLLDSEQKFGQGPVHDS